MQLPLASVAEASKARAKLKRQRQMESWAGVPEPGSKWIPLSRGKFSIVDECTYNKLMENMWYVTEKGYAVRNVRIGGERKTRYMQEEIIDVPDGMERDHINRNKLDNRRQNLRPCFRSQNMANKAKYFGNKTTSKFKGVSFNKRDRLFYAVGATSSGKPYIGCFRKEEDAAIAYDNWARKYYGEFALTNFP